MIFQCKSCHRMFRCHGASKCIFCEGEITTEIEKYERKSFEAGVDACRKIMDELNHMGSESTFAHGFVDEIAHTHRTLQQNLGGLMKAVIAHFASLNKEQYYDARNEATVKLCVKLHEITKEEHLPFI